MPEQAIESRPPGHHNADLLVLGAGPAGIQAAREAARLGASVILVESESIGGRANSDSLLPSKVWLNSADRIGSRHTDPACGLQAAPGGVEAGAVTSRIHELSGAMAERYTAQLTSLGVRIERGSASFVDPNRVRVAASTISAEKILIATGSGPIFLPTMKPDMKRIIAPRFMSRLPEIPASIVVVGGGVTGTEFAYLFNRLGSEVTWLVDEFGVLPPCDREAANFLSRALTARGVRLIEGAAVSSLHNEGDEVTATLEDGRLLRAACGFIAIGRRPHIEGLNLEAAGVATNRAGAIEVDGFLRSNVPHIYAAGDVAGGPMTANCAQSQGYVAARHALGKPVAPHRWDTLVDAVYSDPQLAQVGFTAERAASQGIEFAVARTSFSDNLKARLSGENEGFLKVLYAPDSGRVLGASAVGCHAADTLTALALALRLEARLSDLAGLFPAYPTLSELAFDTARDG